MGHMSHILLDESYGMTHTLIIQFEEERLAFSFPKWEMKYVDSVDILDAVGTNIRIGSRFNRFNRVQSGFITVYSLFS